MPCDAPMPPRIILARSPMPSPPGPIIMTPPWPIGMPPWPIGMPPPPPPPPLERCRGCGGSTLGSLSAVHT
eukprot:5350309-Prymnesium_polylepis.1